LSEQLLTENTELPVVGVQPEPAGQRDSPGSADSPKPINAVPAAPTYASRVTTSETQSVVRKRRSDFEQNREGILGAANDAFTELGAATSINTIAERAGVSPATVYRHFPSRKALVDAVFELRVAAYADAIEAAQEESNPEIAFRQTIHTIVDLQARDRSFREILASRDLRPQEDPGFVRFGTALLSALAAARDADLLIDGVEDSDIMLLLISTEGIARPAGRASLESLHRFVNLALDGICQTRRPVSGPALDFNQVLEIGRS
jgi:AcrR family transcriptional regulator